MTQQKPAARIAWIDLMRCALIFCVVLGHTVVHSAYADRGVARYVWSFHVAGFFWISGYLFRTKNESFPKFALRKFRALMIPYYCFALLSILIFFFAGKFMADRLDMTIRTTDIPMNLFGMLYANSRTGYMKWNFPLWFIPCLYVLELLLYGIERLLRIAARRYSRCVCAAVFGCAWCAAVCVLDRFLRLPALPFQAETALYLTPFALFGCACAACKRRIPEKLCLPAGVLLIILGYLSMRMNPVGKIDYSSNHYGVMPLFYLSALLSTLGWALVCRWASRFDLKALRVVGENTLPVLLMHKFPLMAFQLVLGGAMMRPSPLSLVLVLAVSAAVVAVSVIAGKILERVCPFAVGKRKIPR